MKESAGQSKIAHTNGGGRAQTVADTLARLQPKPGDILLFHHPERFRSRMIAWFTRSPFYHVGIYAGNGQVIEARIPQVMRRDLRFERDGFHFVVIPAPDRAVAQSALAWAEERVGARYDLLSLATLIAGRILRWAGLVRWTCKGRYVCGSFVVQAYEAAGIELFPGRCASEIVPGDFASLLPHRPSSTSSPFLRTGAKWV